MIEPREKVSEWKAGRYEKIRYRPGGVFTWVFPLEKGMDLRGSARLQGVATVTVRRLEWVEADLPKELGVSVELNPMVKISVIEREEEEIKVKFEGIGDAKKPAFFEDRELLGESYSLLDGDGKALRFSTNSTSTGSGPPRRKAFGGRVDGKPAPRNSIRKTRTRHGQA